MTTIIVDTEEGVMASDSLITSTTWQTNPFIGKERNHTLSYDKSQVKVYKGSSILVGGTGDSDLCYRVKQRLLEGMCLPDFDYEVSAKILVMYKIGDTIRTLVHKTVVESRFFGLYKKKYWKTEEINPQVRYVSIGSGEEYALGAILATNDITKSIIAASQCDTGTGGVVHIVDFN